MMPPARAYPWILLLYGGTACSDPAVLGDACEPDVTVETTGAAPPTLTWTPDCAVGIFRITTEPGDQLWSIASDPEPDHPPTNQIRSGVIYGTVPARSHQFGDLIPLNPGDTYRVILHVLDSRGGDAVVGTRLFSVPTE
jgi:hypothetical protein